MCVVSVKIASCKLYLRDDPFDFRTLLAFFCVLFVWHEHASKFDRHLPMHLLNRVLRMLRTI